MQDITSKTPLMKAARSGKLWAVRRLLSFGANVNVRDRNDETALHFACRQGSTEILSMLIKVQSNLNPSIPNDFYCLILRQLNRSHVKTQQRHRFSRCTCCYETD
ncbi:unnamed protein product [Echinostoma caproni]|uniref:ANK_REP_REGION domain-containing protein n=1 Tax=Echinostoma caproni TaxID=27848 RepID=A0A183A387_9TREM|nr:unnamed protein product [Echinostoma caproni]